MDSFDKVYRRYAPVLRKFVTGMLKDSARAEDIVHNIFMRLLSSHAEFATEESLRNWLYVCARNEVISTLRSKWESSVVRVEQYPDNIRSADASESAEASEAASLALRTALSRMPEKRAEVFRLVKLQDLTPEQAALRLGISVRTVEKHLQLAYKDIRGNIS